MHLWPSVRIRETFTVAYLKRLEWNLHRMNSEKQSSTGQHKLLDTEANGVAEKAVTAPSLKSSSGIAVVCREIFMVLSCCYCCFGCGACLNQEES